MLTYEQDRIRKDLTSLKLAMGDVLWYLREHTPDHTTPEIEPAREGARLALDIIEKMEKIHLQDQNKKEDPPDGSGPK